MVPGLVIFDCDGVLVDSEVIYVEIEMDYLARAGLKMDRRSYIASFSGLVPSEFEARVSGALLEQTGRPPQKELHTEMRAACQDAFEARLAEVPGTRHMLEALVHPLCVASSTKTDALYWKLRKTGLLELCMPHIFSSELVKNGKPAPDLFLHAAATTGVAPGDCVVIEDSVNGVKAGKAAGMMVVGFTGGGHCLEGHGEMLAETGADVIVTSHEDLADVIDALMAAHSLAGH